MIVATLQKMMDKYLKKILATFTVSLNDEFLHQLLPYLNNMKLCAPFDSEAIYKQAIA